MSAPRCRLYLITPPKIEDLDAFTASLETALDGGDVACLQIRLKKPGSDQIDEDATRQLGERVIAKVQDRDIAVLINDSAELAVELGADGVHIGQSDMSYKDARKAVGPEGIIGVTCHDSRHLGMEAGEAGADYVAFGAFYPTTTKTPKSVAQPDLLAWWQELMEVPCVAIGGITVQNAEPLIVAGADFLAVSSGVWDHPDGAASAISKFNQLFDAADTAS